jgi:type II secretory pathway pseudopilin PulG
MSHRSPVFRRPFASARRGFTIIELLVAAGVTLILVGLLVSITTGILNTWSRTTGRLSSHNQAKVAFDQLANDLQAIVLRKDANAWLIASIQADQTGAGDAGPATAIKWNPSYAVTTGGIGKPDAAASGAASSLRLAPNSRRLEDYRFGHAGVWLRFFTHEPDSNDDINNVAVPRAVAYQIARVPVQRNGGSDPVTAPQDFPDLRWALFRTRVCQTPFADNSIQNSNRSVLGAGYNLAAAVYTTTAAGGGNPADPGNLRRPDKFDDLLANNVIDFGVRIYERNGNNDVLVFPTDSSYSNNRWCYVATDPNHPNSGTLTPPAPFNSGPAGAANIARGIPSALEVYMRVLTPDGVSRLQALELGLVAVPAEYNVSPKTPGEYWWEIALQHSVTFTRRIDLPVQPR